MERRIVLSSRYEVLQEIYDLYIRGLPADALIPTIADIALSPSINPIITDERTDFIVTRQTFEDINLMQTLPSIFSDWKIRLDDELVRMVQVELSEPFTKDQLLLATTVFYCDTCRINLFYPRVLVHECSTTYRRNPSQCPAWNSSGNIKFNQDVRQGLIDIIDVLGFDPKTVTAKDMMLKNCVLQCLDCRTTRLGRMTMIWNQAVWNNPESYRKRSFLIFFWFFHRLSIVWKSTIVSLRWYLGKFRGMTNNWRCRSTWLRHWLQVIIWIRPNRGSCVAFAGGKEHFADFSNIFGWRELFIWRLGFENDLFSII